MLSVLPHFCLSGHLQVRLCFSLFLSPCLLLLLCHPIRDAHLCMDGFFTAQVLDPRMGEPTLPKRLSVRPGERLGSRVHICVGAGWTQGQHGDMKCSYDCQRGKGAAVLVSHRDSRYHGSRDKVESDPDDQARRASHQMSPSLTNQGSSHCTHMSLCLGPKDTALSPAVGMERSLRST
jgi:hypothetical protein